MVGGRFEATQAFLGADGLQGGRVVVLMKALILVLCSAGGGCGPSSAPFASGGDDLRALSVNTEVIRARGISDSDIPLLARFPRLGVLNLRAGVAVRPQALTEDGFRRLASLKVETLRAITVGCSDAMTDGAVGAIATIRSLRVVQLVRCGPFGMEGLRSLGGLRQLQELDLRGCKQIDDSCIEALADLKQLTKTRALRVTGTRLSPNGISELRARLGEMVVDDSIEYWRAEDPAAHGVFGE